MKYMLDTNICSYIIKHRPPEVLAQFHSFPMEEYCISSITHAELKYWVARNYRMHKKSNNMGVPKINAQIIQQFVSHLMIVEFGVHAGEIYATTRDYLEEKGLPVGDADLFIGSHAISLNAILVTNNVKDFKHFPHIKLENWIK